MKTKKNWTAALCLGLLTLVGGSRLSAADKAITPTAEEELQAKMKAQGWKEISKGVYERQRGPNRFEHLGYGKEGLSWTIGELSRQVSALMQEYLRYPSEDLYKVIDRLRLKIADSKRQLVNMKSLSSISEDIAETGCSLCYSAVSDAYPLSGSSGQGVGAIADASFNSSCGYSGSTDAYAYARANVGTTVTTHTMDDPHTGTAVTSHATATVNGTSNCLSTTSASVTSTALSISYTTTDSNSTCPAPPPPSLTVTISGPTSVTKFTGLCKAATWTSTVSGGTTPYTYAWTIDGVAAGTSSSLTQTYCPDDIETVSVGLTATDSASNSGSATFSTSVDVEGGGGGCPLCSQAGPGH